MNGTYCEKWQNNKTMLIYVLSFSHSYITQSIGSELNLEERSGARCEVVLECGNTEIESVYTVDCVYLLYHFLNIKQ